jgi:hypothetical protein
MTLPIKTSGALKHNYLATSKAIPILQSGLVRSLFECALVFYCSHLSRLETVQNHLLKLSVWTVTAGFVFNDSNFVQMLLCFLEGITRCDLHLNL